VRLAICTNNVREWQPKWLPTIPDDLFELIVDSGFEGTRKPEPEIYAIVLSRLGLPAEACVFVDDLEPNVDAARDLGFAVIHHVDTDRTIARLGELLPA